MQEIKESLERWIQHGISPGSFLMAVLENNLREACARADLSNRRRLAEIVTYLFNHCPAACWGSPERTREWIEQKRLDRLSTL